jgi:hypothetical protein
MTRLSTFPGSRHPAPLPEFAPGELSPRTFVREFVNETRPCVLRGAARDWKPLQRFSLRELRATASLSDAIGRVLSEPLIEGDSTRRLNNRYQAKPLLEFLDQLESDTEYVQAYATPCIGPLAFLNDDLDLFHRLASTTERPREYARMRAFFYRNGFTDWHAHPADETLTTQVASDKVFALIAPNPAAHRALNGVKTAIWNADLPELASAPVYRTTLRPGDVLYVPVYWWHAAEANGSRHVACRTLRASGDIWLTVADRLNSACQARPATTDFHRRRVMVRHAHKVVAGLTASLALLVLGSWPRSTSAFFFCVDLKGCSGQAFCGDQAANQGSCRLKCNDGTTVQCNTGGS